MTELILNKTEAAMVNNWVKTAFPAVIHQRHAFCKECGTEYGFTKRTYCPRCDAHTVDAWQFRYEEVA